MKFLVPIILAAAMLTGCETNPTIPEPSIVIKYKYIVETVPDDMLVVPNSLPKIDPNSTDDAALADWLLDGEKRALEIESKLKAIKALQEQRLKDLDAYPKDDVIIK
jgi:hypothetical protein